jgi:hypothetical protein
MIRVVEAAANALAAQWRMELVRMVDLLRKERGHLPNIASTY